MPKQIIQIDHPLSEVHIEENVRFVAKALHSSIVTRVYKLYNASRPNPETALTDKDLHIIGEVIADSILDQLSGETISNAVLTTKLETFIKLIGNPVEDAK